MLGLAALCACALAAPAQAATTPGIDVSMWQASINWTKVRADGIRFAFVKATQNTAFTDPQYATNVAAARAAGVRVGAYDFADPTDGTTTHITNNAIADANHFVDVAQPQPVDLRPVLDVEQTNGLTVKELTLWVRTWVSTVAGRVHARPIIYTSPYFWQTRLGDTAAISADADLWVAHWTTAAQPWVPASDWGGLSWSFWQFSNCRHIAGISGCVDGDRMLGTSFIPFLVGRLPEAAAAPSLTGIAAVDRTVSAAAGSWRGTRPIAFSYQWQRCDAAGANCRPITGATSSSYRAAAADYLHTLRIRVSASNRLGAVHAQSAVTAQVADLTAPGATRFSKPRLHYQSSGSFTAAWQANDPLSGVASYDIQTRRLTAASAGAWTDALVAQPDTSLALTAPAGTTTCLRGRATDAAGNRAPWSAPSCSAVPWQAAAFGHSQGWTAASDGSVRARRGGAALYRRGLTADEVGVRVRMCQTCGAVAVSFGRQLLGTIHLHAASAHDATVRMAVPASARAGTLRLTTVDARPVRIEAIGVLRYS